MRTIIKGREPPSLARHRRTDYSDYDNLPSEHKDELRRALVAEQRGICCYCMGRIRGVRTAIKIEHWRPRRRYPQEELVYRNLLGACLGGEGQPVRLQHCDTRKGDRDLLLNPAELGHVIEARLRYEVDGSIRSDDETFDAQIESVLNLNLPLLRNRRKRVLDGVLDWWEGIKTAYAGPVPRSWIQRERDRRLAGAGELAEYCQVAVWWLDQRLASMPT